MTPEDLLIALEGGLKNPFDRLGLSLNVMAEEDDALDMLTVSPSQSRAVLLCEEVSVPDTDAAQDSGMAELEMRLIIQQPKGLASEKGAGVWKPKGDGKLSLLELCTQARAFIQRVRFPGRTDVAQEKTAFRYLGQKPFRPLGMRTLRAFELTFRLTVALDMPQSAPLNLTIT